LVGTCPRTMFAVLPTSAAILWTARAAT